MTDHQQAAIEAVKKARDRHYVTFPSYEQSLTCACGSNVDGHTYSELVAAAEPHLRRKWAEEIVNRMPGFVYDTENYYALGVKAGINYALDLLKGAGE